MGEKGVVHRVAGFADKVMNEPDRRSVRNDLKFRSSGTMQGYGNDDYDSRGKKWSDNTRSASPIGYDPAYNDKKKKKKSRWSSERSDSNDLLDESPSRDQSKKKKKKKKKRIQEDSES